MPEGRRQFTRIREKASWQANNVLVRFWAPAMKRFSGVKWTVVERIVWAWLLILPATGLISYVWRG
jgi:phosphate/sulfate permease